MTRCDIVLVGVGGQGVLTLADLLVRSSLAAGLPAVYVPTKGMAQRGGFVKVEVRLGADGVGPRISERGADLVVAMERSEALKGLSFVRPEGEFVLYDHVWEPAGVQLGRDSYPILDDVRSTIEKHASQVAVLNPAGRPAIEGRPVAANVYVFGALLTLSPLRDLIPIEVARTTLETRWPKAAEGNRFALEAGTKAAESWGGAIG